MRRWKRRRRRGNATSRRRGGDGEGWGEGGDEEEKRKKEDEERRSVRGELILWIVGAADDSGLPRVQAAFRLRRVLVCIFEDLWAGAKPFPDAALRRRALARYVCEAARQDWPWLLSEAEVGHDLPGWQRHERQCRGDRHAV
eukprot:169971-Pyramimonas_sp.AAC.1